MGSVYKRHRRDGKLQRNWSIIYFDHTGKRVTKSARTSDKRAAERILAEKEAQVALIRAGAVDPLQERYVVEANRPIADHLADYLEWCSDKQEPLALKEKKRHLDWMLEQTGAVRLADIRPDLFDQKLVALGKQGRAARTINLKIEAAKAFLNWCVRMGRLRSNPLVVVQKRNETLGRKRERRVLTDEEIRRLLEVARDQAAQYRSARYRPLWYMLPLEAGLRKGDMDRLTWGDLDLEGAVMTIRGGKAKHRIDRLPLSPTLVRELLAMKPQNVLPSARVFPAPVANATRQQDFERAGIPLKTENGWADLHALRTTYGTRLALAGVPPAVHKDLMRHSTIELSMRYYTKLGVEDLRRRGVAMLEARRQA